MNLVQKPGSVTIGGAARARVLSLFLQERMVNRHVEIFQDVAACKGARAAELDLF